MNAKHEVYLLRATCDCQDPWHEYRTLDLLHTARGRVRKFKTLGTAVSARKELDMTGCWEVVISAPDQRPICNSSKPRPVGAIR